MSDLIRQAREAYGEQELEQMMDEAGKIKAEYVMMGGPPEDVFSPERVSAMMSGQDPRVLPESMRHDGTVAAPYVPIDIAVANKIIEPQAMPAVTEALMDDINTVSSGSNDDGTGFAIGRAPNGEVVKIVK